METPADVLFYFDSITGEPRQGRLLTISPHGYYEANLQFPGGPRRALLPIVKTFVVAKEVQESPESLPEIER